MLFPVLHLLLFFWIVCFVSSQAPTFANLPNSVTIKESVPASTATADAIFLLTASDPNGDVFSCTDTAISPNVNAFLLQYEATGSTYNLYVVDNAPASPSFEYDSVNKYTYTVTCTDANGNASSADLVINVTPNDPPTIAPLTPVNIDSFQTAAMKVSDLSLSDTENDVIKSCTIGGGGPFNLQYSSGAYSIWLDPNPSLSSPSYDINITCYDDWGQSSAVQIVYITSNTPPQITSLPASVSVSETATAPSDLITIAVNDADGQDVRCSLLSVPSGPFIMFEDLSTPEFKVQLISNAYTQLDYSVTSSYTISVTCNDTVGGSDTKNLLVNIVDNAAPVVTLSQNTASVSENNVAEQKLCDLTVTDAENDPYTCSFNATVGSTYFDLRYDGTKYSLYLRANMVLDYDTVPTYYVTVVCDGTNGGGSGTAMFTLDLTENTAPTFTNLPGSRSHNVMTVVQYDLLYTATATDSDGDTVYFNMSSNPVGPFEINAATGDITATSSLKSETNSLYLLTVQATDLKDSTEAVFSLVLSNLNTAPTLSNMVLNDVVTIYKLENIATGSTLYDLGASDPDAGQTLTITYSISPSGQETFFKISNSDKFALRNGNTFDYEAISSYIVTFYVSDSITTTGPYMLQIIVQQEAEPCSFDKRSYTASTFEAGAGYGEVDLGFLLSDNDSPDTHTYSLLNSFHYRYFQIDQVSGIITFKVNYDYDVNHPHNATLIVQCTDSYGMTGTATVYIYVNDVNDNDPTFYSGGYVITVSQYTRAGDYIGNIRATDIDSGRNAVISYTGSSVTGSSYYNLAKNGNFYLTREIDFEYGTTHRFTVVAVDDGTPQRTGTTTVDIIYRFVTTTTSTTIGPYNEASFWDEPGNIALVVVAALLALIPLALLLIYLIRKFLGKGDPSCFKNCCKSKPRPKVKNPKNPKNEPFDFWKDNDLNAKREPFSTQRDDDNIPQAMVA